MDYTKIGIKIAGIRAAAGLTREAFAQSIWSNVNSLFDWEHGNSLPSVYFLQRICEVYHVTPNYLFGMEEPDGRNREEESNEHFIQDTK